MNMIRSTNLIVLILMRLVTEIVFFSGQIIFIGSSLYVILNHMVGLKNGAITSIFIFLLFLYMLVGLAINTFTPNYTIGTRFYKLSATLILVVFLANMNINLFEFIKNKEFIFLCIIVGYLFSSIYHFTFKQIMKKILFSKYTNLELIGLGSDIKENMIIIRDSVYNTLKPKFQRIVITSIKGYEQDAQGNVTTKIYVLLDKKICHKRLRLAVMRIPYNRNDIVI